MEWQDVTWLDEGGVSAVVGDGVDWLIDQSTPSKRGKKKIGIE